MKTSTSPLHMSGYGSFLYNEYTVHWTSLCFETEPGINAGRPVTMSQLVHL